MKECVVSMFREVHWKARPDNRDFSKVSNKPDRDLGKEHPGRWSFKDTRAGQEHTC